MIFWEVIIPVAYLFKLIYEVTQIINSHFVLKRL